MITGLSENNYLNFLINLTCGIALSVGNLKIGFTLALGFIAVILVFYTFRVMNQTATVRIGYITVMVHS